MNLEVTFIVLGIARIIMMYYQTQQSAMKLWTSQKQHCQKKTSGHEKFTGGF